jgi:predicted enzyme related to lactoylglutathione lyase
MFDKIAFVHYETENLDRALKFYKDVLGLTLRVQNREWIEFDVGGQRLALRKVDTMPRQPEALHPTGAMVWLEVRPIEQAIAHLKNNKVKIINNLEIFPYGKTATFADPDSNPIGLYEPPEKNA